jgi:RHS repeat-associated protein
VNLASLELSGWTVAYDFENHLTQHGALTMVYDGDGNRVAETVGGVTTNYLVDTVNPTSCAQVVDELQSGTVTRSYSYGLERISETQTLNSVLTTSFYGYDGHGSVRFLTNSAGAITDTYDYDAFGNLINSTGSTPNVYLFAGEAYDAALGLYYNRARYLNTTTGRFWSMDGYEGKDKEPPSLHRYNYASGDPVDRSDPNGLQDFVSELGAESIATELNNMTSIQGQAIMDQIKYGGNAGLKSLFITGAIVGGAIAIQSFGSFAREIPLLKAGTPGSVIANKMSAVEVELAQEVVEFRGGTFVGQTIRDTAGIDGFLEGVPASLKTMTSIRPGTLFKNVVRAAEQAEEAGYAGVELFISAKGFAAKDLVDDPTILPRIAEILREGTLSAVSILSANGWIRVVP